MHFSYSNGSFIIRSSDDDTFLSAIISHNFHHLFSILAKLHQINELIALVYNLKEENNYKLW